MVKDKLKSLISKLNQQTRASLEKAIAYCVRRAHYNVELEHYLLTLLEQDNLLITQLLAQSELDLPRLKVEILDKLESLKIGNDHTPAISNRVIDLIEEAWTMASLDLNHKDINSGVLLLACYNSTILRQVLVNLSTQFSKLDPHQLTIQLNTLILAGESVEVAKDQSNHTDHNLAQGLASNKESALQQFCINLNEQAQQGKIDAAVGREIEIRQMIDILGRRRQNNAILTGEPGVGKTAIVEGLAYKIINQDVPDKLKSVVIYSLDIGLLQAGAGVKGEFENRLKSLIHEVKSSPVPIILFIDEAHTIIGAGGKSGQGDAANLLKPALARGELRSIAATTWAEYKEYFEQDAALARRFQVVKIDEPDCDKAMTMLRSLTPQLEQHHQVMILDSAIQAATRLSARYIAERQLPDKSISVLDTACARVASKQTTMPAQLELSMKNKVHAEKALAQLTKEEQQGIQHAEEISTLEERIKTLSQTINKLETQWQAEKTLMSELLEQLKLISDNSNDKSNSEVLDKITRIEEELKQVQGDSPLIQAYVDDTVVAEVITDWTGVPVANMLKSDIERILNLEQLLVERIKGQSYALSQISANLKTNSAKLMDPRKPLGVFLFVGPSGVGKTETALALTELLYGTAEKLTTINMSEFKEAHRVSLLAGAPPGYVGYGKGGVLTEAVRRKPYSIILLDEIEKAHASIQDVFYQVFDKGVMQDGQGREVDFKNTLIIMTSNAGSELIHSLYDEGDNDGFINDLKDPLYQELTRYFKPAFLGRVNIIPYLPLGDDILQSIIALQFARISTRFEDAYRAHLQFDNKITETIMQQCQLNSIGARQIDNVINQQILPQLSTQILNSSLQAEKIKDGVVTLDKSNQVIIN